MEIGATRYTKAKDRKASAWAKESATKAKTTAATGTFTAATTLKEEKANSTINRLGKEIHSKDKDMANEKITATFGGGAE